MANASIKSAFEQFWGHVLSKINNSTTQLTENIDTKLSTLVGNESVSNQIDYHNTSSDAHSDIRDLVSELEAAADEHTHTAAQISAGTFGGQVAANASGQNSDSYVLRNTKVSATVETPTVAGQICWKYE